MIDLVQRLTALTPAQKALLANRLRNQAGAFNTFPLSYAQQRLWLLDQLQPDNTSYNIPAAFALHGAVHVGALEHSIAHVLQRHEVLRTTFVAVAGQPVQVIQPLEPFALAVTDLTNLPDHDERSRQAQRVIDDEGARAFDLARGPLIRFRLIRVEPTEHILFIAMHHICSDGWSITIIARELAALYPAFLAGQPLPLAPLPIQYADYAVWQHEQAQDAEQQRQIAYWRERLQGAPPFLEMPSDYQRPAMQTTRHDEFSQRMATPLSAALTAYGRQQRSTLFMTLLTIFQILVYRQTGQPDLVIGMPIANRNRPEIEDVIGFFVNTLALRCDLAGDPSFHDLLAATRALCLGAYAHQDVSFDRLLEELRPPRDLSYSPIYQIFFNMANVPDMPDYWGDLAVEELPMHDYGAKFDLTLFVDEVGDSVDLRIVYNADLFTAERMTELLAQYILLAEQCMADPYQHISHLTLVTPTALTRLPNPTAPLPADWEGSVSELFARRAVQTPDKTAIIDGQERWTYQDLETRSNQLARHLQAQQVQPGDVVAIYAHRSAAIVWAILGIFKAGATYTILDPTYPAARLIDYVQQARPCGYIMITEAPPLSSELVTFLAGAACRCLAQLPPRSQADAQALFHEYSAEPPPIMVGPDDIASITFTSGSTGRPKGILQRHGPLTHFLPWLADAFGLTADDHYSMLSGLAHDPLQRDIFTPLALGATLCIPDGAEIGTPGWIAHWMREMHITVTNLTPAMVQLVTQARSDTLSLRLPALRRAFMVGDTLKRHDITQLWELAPDVMCINFFGATETQRALSYYIIPRLTADAASQYAKEAIPLGHGIPDTQMLLLTPTGQLAGIGEAGEINVRSPHLAKGYLDNANLTAARFITNPFTNEVSDRLYRTGDLGRYLPNGDVEYMARTDQQVKIRGFRIELGEIESVLKALPTVKDAAVLVLDDGGEDKYLAAYVVPITPLSQHIVATDVIADLRSQLQSKLPSYMLPAAYVFLTTIPLTPNGKLDRQALPPPDRASNRIDDRADPRTREEALLVDLWSQILGIARVGIYDNFFDLGGHSLKATQLVARVADATGVQVPLRRLFEAPTIAQFAPLIATTDNPKTIGASLPIPRLSRPNERDDATW